MLGLVEPSGCRLSREELTNYMSLLCRSKLNSLYIIQRKFSDFISFASAMKKINRRFVFFTIFAIVGMSILNAIGPMPFDITTLIPVGR